MNRRILTTVVAGLSKEVLNKLISIAIMLTVKRALNGWIKFGVSLGSCSMMKEIRGVLYSPPPLPLSHAHTVTHTRWLTWKLIPLSGCSQIPIVLLPTIVILLYFCNNLLSNEKLDRVLSDPSCIKWAGKQNRSWIGCRSSKVVLLKIHISVYRCEC